MLCSFSFNFIISTFFVPIARYWSLYETWIRWNTILYSLFLYWLHRTQVITLSRFSRPATIRWVSPCQHYNLSVHFLRLDSLLDVYEYMAECAVFTARSSLCPFSCLESYWMSVNFLWADALYLSCLSLDYLLHSATRKSRWLQISLSLCNSGWAPLVFSASVSPWARTWNHHDFFVSLLRGIFLLLLLSRCTLFVWDFYLAFFTSSSIDASSTPGTLRCYRREFSDTSGNALFIIQDMIHHLLKIIKYTSI